MIALDLLWGWTRVGIFGFGGGPAMIPLMKVECVERYAWMTETEFVDALALGYSLPGPIAAKMAVVVGWQAGGGLGAFAAFVGVMLPAMVLMMALMGAYWRFKEAPAVIGAMKVVRPVVIGLLLYTVVDLFPSAGIGGEAGWGKSAWTALAITLAAFGLLWISVHPAIVIAGAMGLGALFLAG